MMNLRWPSYVLYRLMNDKSHREYLSLALSGELPQALIEKEAE
jgi:hypothetical protein